MSSVRRGDLLPLDVDEQHRDDGDDVSPWSPRAVRAWTRAKRGIAHFSLRDGDVLVTSFAATIGGMGHLSARRRT